MINTTNQLIADKTEECYATLEKIHGRTFDRPKIELKQLGKKSGVAYYIRNSIYLNSDFMKNGHLDDMINRTLPHEIAHLVSFKVFGMIGRGHVTYWKLIMRQLGLKPSRCHTYSLEGVKVRNITKIEYKCGCPQSVKVGLKVHRNIVCGRKYKCKRCNTVLQRLLPPMVVAA